MTDLLEFLRISLEGVGLLLLLGFLWNALFWRQSYFKACQDARIRPITVANASFYVIFNVTTQTFWCGFLYGFTGKNGKDAARFKKPSEAYDYAVRMGFSFVQIDP